MAPFELRLPAPPRLAQRPLADCVGILPDANAEEMRSAIERELEGVDPNEWK